MPLPDFVVFDYIPDKIEILNPFFKSHVIEFRHEDEDDDDKNNCRSLIMFCMFCCYSYYVNKDPIAADETYDWAKNKIEELITSVHENGEYVNMRFSCKGTIRDYSPHLRCYKWLDVNFYPDLVFEFFQDEEVQ